MLILDAKLATFTNISTCARWNIWLHNAIKYVILHRHNVIYIKRNIHKSTKLYKFKGRKCTFECEGAITCLKKYKYSSIDFVLMNVIYQCACYHKHLSTCISDVAHPAMRVLLINNVSAGINIPTVCTRLLLVKNKGSRPDYWGSCWGVNGSIFIERDAAHSKMISKKLIWNFNINFNQGKLKMSLTVCKCTLIYNTLLHNIKT